jgi:hypothetical protein
MFGEVIAKCDWREMTMNGWESIARICLNDQEPAQGHRNYGLLKRKCSEISPHGGITMMDYQDF